MSHSPDSMTAVLGYLSDTQKEDLIFSLISRLEEAGVPQTLREVVQSLKWETDDVKLKDAMAPHCILMLRDETMHVQLLEVANLFEKLVGDILVTYAIQTLKSFIAQDKYLFIPSFNDIVKGSGVLGKFQDKDSVNAVQPLDLISIFKFSERWPLTGSPEQQLQFDTLSIYLTLAKIEEVSQAALRVVLWRIDRMVRDLSILLWEVIFCGVNSTTVIYKRTGLIVWLKFLAVGEDIKDLQKHLESESYWIHLREELLSSLHEHRKFAVYILQLSIKSIDFTFTNSVMEWQNDEKDLYLQAWKRYITLYEIIGIDTSLNQARDAAGEMIGLLSPDSKIPIPFTLSLLSMGFKLSMETVRKFAMNLVFAVPEGSLICMKADNYEFVTTVFLQFAMTASNFVVTKNFDDSFKGEYRCEFGEYLSEFIRNCYQNLNSKDALQLTTKLILLLSRNKDLFDLPKTYVSLGLWKGLKHRGEKILGVEQVRLLDELAQTISDGQVSNSTLQTINLRLLLFINPEKISLRSIIASITHFVQLNTKRTGVDNGFAILGMNSDYFLDYLSEYFTESEKMQTFEESYMTMDVDTLVVFLSLIVTKQNLSQMIAKILQHPQLDELLVLMAKSKLPFGDIFNDHQIKTLCGDLFNRLGNGAHPIDTLYEDAYELINYQDVFDELYWDKFDVSGIWDAVSSGLQTTEEDELRMAVSQMKFLADVVDRSIYTQSCEDTITMTHLKELRSKAFCNLPKKLAPNFYKTKDLFWSRFYQMLTKLSGLILEKDEVLSLVEDDLESVDKEGKLALVNIMQKVLDNLKTIELDDSRKVLLILESMWEDITTERLVLGQRVLQICIIRLLFHERNMINAMDDSEISSRMISLGSDIIDKCLSRKGLLPEMMKTIAQHQIDHFQDFEKSSWILELVVNVYSFLQNENNVFRSEYVIGDLFDANLSLYYGEKLYNKIYGDEEVSTTVNVSMVIGSLKSSAMAEHVWEYILSNESQFHLLAPKSRADGYEESRRIRLLQLLLLTSKTVSIDYLSEVVSEKVLRLLFQEQSPLCRMYMEWIIAYTLFRSDSDKRAALFGAFQKQVVKKQQQTLVASFERTSYLLAQQLSCEEESEFLTKFLVEFLLPSCTSNRSLIRHFSVSLIVSIYPEIEKRHLKFDESLINTMKLIYGNALRTENYQSYRSGDALLWDIKQDFTLLGIFGGVMLRVSDREVEFIETSQFQKYSTQEQRDNLQLSIGKDETNLFLSHLERITKPVMDSIYIDKSSSALQTKSGAWSTVMDVDPKDSESESKKVKRSPLIVVSSLVDKIVNLGAICRLCDCLGVSTLTLNDISVLQHPQFKTVSVTAEQWMPMVEVRIEDIIEYMRYQKTQGYTLIGLEQTDESVELNSEFKFPEKSLILLGKEREGIPGEFLSELDICVEIKQAGVIRSMNIQTATAVICHAYSIQHI